MERELINNVIDKVRADAVNQDFTAIEDMLELLITIDTRTQGRICAILNGYIDKD